MPWMLEISALWSSYVVGLVFVAAGCRVRKLIIIMIFKP
jgi:hypothetical protein